MFETYVNIGFIYLLVIPQIIGYLFIRRRPNFCTNVDTSGHVLLRFFAGIAGGFLGLSWGLIAAETYSNNDNITFSLIYAAAFCAFVYLFRVVAGLFAYIIAAREFKSFKFGGFMGIFLLEFMPFIVSFILIAAPLTAIRHFLGA